jgi:hypothetical protein
MGERIVPSTDARDPSLTPNDGLTHDPDWGWSLNYGHYGSRDDEVYPVWGGERRPFVATFSVELCGHGDAGRARAELLWARRHELAALVATHTPAARGVPTARLSVREETGGSLVVGEYDFHRWSDRLSSR